MHRRRSPSLALVLTFSACGGTGEAADPSEILGDDLHYRGADGAQADQDVAAAEDPSQAAANESECQRAAEHIAALGFDLEVASITDPQERQRAQARRSEFLASEEAAQHVREFTRVCLEQGRTRAEMDCVVRAKSEADLDRCESAP